jgi:riboflavin synthase
VFTGLIEAVGTVREVRTAGAGRRLTVEVHWPDTDAPRTGDSIAVNGACLTVASLTATTFAADLSPETVERTLLGQLRAQHPVNLERAVRIGSRLGGHIVQGHVDSVIRVRDVRQRSGFWEIRFELPGRYRSEVVEKGSVAVHGVSLTVSTLGEDWFEVAVIPVTLEATLLASVRPGDRLHLETDILGKYVARQLNAPGTSSIEELFAGGADATG